VKRAVLDASAMIFLLENQPGGEIVEQAITEGLAGRAQLLMSVVNWGEVFYSTWRAHGPDAAARAIAEISQIPIQIVVADSELTKSAAELRAKHDLPYADCFAAALAKMWEAELMTSDPHFVRISSYVDVRFL
jgi:predicted nucleic acid-binding protein